MIPRSVVAAVHLSEPSGATRALEPGLERLAAAGAEVTVAVPGPGRTANELSRFARIVHLGHEPLAIPRRPGAALGLAKGLRTQVRRFRGLLRRENADLVVVSTLVLPALTVAARLEGVPVVLSATELFTRGRRSDDLSAPFRRAIGAIDVRAADSVLACSRTVAEHLPAGAPVVVMYPPIDPKPPEGDAERFRAMYGVPGTGPCLAALGNVTHGRAQDVAVRALAELRRDLPGARLVVANLPHPNARDRAYDRSVRALARDLGVADAVHFCGLANRFDVFAACDVVINPARFAETFGIVAVEALVSGRPVVSTDVGAIPEVLEHERHALLVQPDHPKALAAAVRRLVDDPALAARLVAAGREHVLTDFSAERQLPRFDEAIALALASAQ